MEELEFIKIQYINSPVHYSLFAGIVLGALYYFLLFDGGKKELVQIKNIEAQIVSKQNDLNAAEQKKREYRLLRKEIIELKKNFVESFGNFGNEFRISEVISSLNVHSRRSFFQLSQINPRGSIEQPKYFEIPVKITGIGTYLAIIKFLYYLLNEPRIFTMKTINLSQGKGGSTTFLNMSLDITVYQIKMDDINLINELDPLENK